MEIEQVWERFAQGWPRGAGCEDARGRFCCCWAVVVDVAAAGVGVGVCDGGVVNDGADRVSSRNMCERAHESREYILALDVVVL